MLPLFQSGTLFLSLLLSTVSQTQQMALSPQESALKWVISVSFTNIMKEATHCKQSPKPELNFGHMVKLPVYFTG